MTLTRRTAMLATAAAAAIPATASAADDTELLQLSAELRAAWQEYGRRSH